MTPAPRVLVADDQPDVVAALRLLLRGAGFEVDRASSVDDVRRLTAGQTYDLLLLDLNYTRDTTSGREGLDLLTEIHARDRLLPVIVMTGWGTIDTAVEAMRRGAKTFVHKPWDNRTLVTTVLREIEDGHAQRLAEHLTSTEHADAQAIQRALLPPALPSLPGGGLAVRWEPAAAFGGDCYDVARLSDRHVSISIADVCGKGLPAALLMSNLIASLRAFGTADRSPRDVVSSINRALCRNQDLRRFVTVFYGVYDVDTGRLTYTNAGHNAPILARCDGCIERLATGGMVTGIIEGAPFDEGVRTLRSGDRLLLFTDGLTEARSQAGVEFEDARLVEAVRRHRNCDAEVLVARIFEDVAAFAGGPLQDDATAVVVALS